MSEVVPLGARVRVYLPDGDMAIMAGTFLGPLPMNGSDEQVLLDDGKVVDHTIVRWQIDPDLRPMPQLEYQRGEKKLRLFTIDSAGLLLSIETVLPGGAHFEIVNPRARHHRHQGIESQPVLAFELAGTNLFVLAGDLEFPTRAAPPA